jgi:hypothetical protein
VNPRKVIKYCVCLSKCPDGRFYLLGWTHVASQAAQTEMERSSWPLSAIAEDAMEEDAADGEYGELQVSIDKIIA